MNQNRKARLELLLIAAVAIAFAIVELYIDSFERLVVWMTENESLLTTEIVTLALVLASGLSVYSFRRWREAVALEADKMRLQESVTVEQDAKQLMRSYAEAVMRGQEAERRRLARELHDDTIQRLILLNQKVELAAFDLADTPAARELEDMKEVISTTITHVRQFIQALRPSYLDELGLVATLRTLIKERREHSDLLIEFDVSGREARLSEGIELALYRIAQSALSNVIQHAEASNAIVRLDFLENGVRLTIVDDGRGFELVGEKHLVNNGHFGLVGMRERAELLGASFRLDSRLGSGTRIIVTVPLSPS